MSDEDVKCFFCNDTGYAIRYGIEEECKNCDFHARKQGSGSTIKKLTVTTDEERKQWIEILKLASDYHFDMGAQFEPEIKSINGDTKEEKVAQVHRAWGKAIQEATELISYWELEDENEIKDSRNYESTTNSKYK
jgi:hypothetical protein